MNPSKSVDPTFWRGKKVFLTGHTGFKGSWMSLWLAHMGSQVTGYSLDPAYSPSIFELAQVGKQLAKDVRGDINHFENLKNALVDSKAEIVVHMAAQPLVRLSYREPIKTYLDNVMGTLNVLEAVRQCPWVKSVVIITTDKCYENREWVWPYREDEAMGGYDPYSSSKACAEIATAAWRRSFFENGGHPAKVATVRAGNVIGGGDWSEDRLIPDAIRAINSKSTLSIRNPGAVRPWQHVLDPINGYLMLAERLYKNDKDISPAFNFGPSEDDSVSVETVLNQFKSHWGDDFSWKIESSSTQPHEAGLLKLDSSRAKRQLGWKPRWNLSQALEQTATWYKSALRTDQNMRDVSIHQIETFIDDKIGNLL